MREIHLRRLTGSTIKSTNMTPQYQFQSIVSLPLSNDERDKQTLSAENVGAAVAALHRDGIVVLENAANIDHIDTLNQRLTEEADILAALPTTHFNDVRLCSPVNSNEDVLIMEKASGGKGSTGNMSQAPPVTPELMYEDIWANGPASAVISSVLGPAPHVIYVNGNTNLAKFGGVRQSVHADLMFNHAQLPFAIVANYYLVDVSPANGSTELWIGSHRDTSFADHKNCTETFKKDEFGIRDDLLKARRAWAPPIQPTVKKGSVVLRDLRLWHAGLSNPASEHRIMLAWVHTPWWYKSPAVVVLPEKARPLIDRWATREKHPVVYHTHFVPDDIDHKTIEFTPVFESENKSYNALLPKLPEEQRPAVGEDIPMDSVGPQGIAV